MTPIYNSLIQIMKFINCLIAQKKINKINVLAILRESLKEDDFFCKRSRSLLEKIGFKADEAMILLAYYKSKFKYGYELSAYTLKYLLDLSKRIRHELSVKVLTESPFFILKAGWLYEHAPFFMFYKKNRSEILDNYIIKFTLQYCDLFLNNKVPVFGRKRNTPPRRILAATFWERKIFDPILHIANSIEQNIEGCELSIDFHPFNYTHLLPEELSKEKRELIRKTIKRNYIKLDIHSPVIGPYFPSPNPAKGKQLFFNPLQCFELQCATIDLAKDIGARSVVVHLIDHSNIRKWIELIMRAEDSRVRVTLENYCLTDSLQNSHFFISYVDEIFSALPRQIRENNFGITLDVGHLNIEDEDPLIASEKIGQWCRDKGVFLRIHASDNYGKLPFNPPAYSADIHNSVSGRGINNAAIIMLLRSMGHTFDVVAEQTQPLTPEDISIIHEAQSCPINKSYEALVSKGREKLSNTVINGLIDSEILKKKPYLFLTGLKGIESLREHLIYRKIQKKKYLTVDDVKNISQDYMKMPDRIRLNLIEYIDNLLLNMRYEISGSQKRELDLVYQNINGTLFADLNNEQLDQIFSESIACNKGDIICEQDTIGQEMFLIKRGKASIFINESQIASLASGEIFGEMSLFHNVKRTATIKAAQDKTLIGVLTRSGLEEIIKKDTVYSHALIFRLNNILSERLRILNEKYKNAIDSLHSVLCLNVNQIPQINKTKMDMELKSSPSYKPAEGIVKSVFKDLKFFDKNQIICSQGDRGDGAYLILDGKARVSIYSSDNQEILLGELGRYEIFGEMALIDKKPRSATIITKTPCKLAFASEESFVNLLESRSDLSFQLMAIISLSLYKRLLRLDNIYGDIKKLFDESNIRS